MQQEDGVDEPLHFALDEKLHQIEMTDKGREFIARAANTDTSFFVIPDVGEEIARIEREFEASDQRRFFEHMKEAQEVAFDAIRAGSRCAS